VAERGNLLPHTNAWGESQRRRRGRGREGGNSLFSMRRKKNILHFNQQKKERKTSNVGREKKGPNPTSIKRGEGKKKERSSIKLSSIRQEKGAYYLIKEKGSGKGIPLFEVQWPE